MTALDSMLPISAGNWRIFYNDVNAWLETGTGAIVLKVVGAVAMLILGWFVAKFLGWVAYKALCRTTWDDKLAEKLGLKMLMEKEKSGDENAVERAVAKVVYYILLALAVVAALQYSGLTQVAAPIEGLVSSIFLAIPKIGMAAAILAVAYFGGRILKMLIQKLTDNANLDARFAEMTETEDGDEEAKISFGDMIGNIVFWLVMFFGLAGALDALEIESLSQPVSNAVDQLVAVLPALAKAALIVGAGYILGRIARTIVSNLLDSVSIDKAVAKVGIERLFEKTSAAQVVGIVVFYFIMLQATIAGLNELKLNTLSEPLANMVGQFWLLLPSLAVAVLIIAVGVVLGRVVRGLTDRLLRNIGFNDLLDKIGLGALKNRSEKLDEPSELVAYLVFLAIILLSTAQALEVMGLDTWAVYLNTFLGYVLKHVSVALAIVLVGFAISSYVRDIIIGEGEDETRRWVATVARYFVLVISFTMAVRQLDVAPDFVNIAFALSFGALCLALALAFGLGSRPVAEEIVKKQYAKAQEKMAK